MKAIALSHASATRRQLLDLAEEIPGAWIGVRICAMLLLLEGRSSGWITRLLGLHRSNLHRWVQRVNRKGIQELIEKPRSGRPGQLTVSIERQLEVHLGKPPERYGWARVQWDGPTLVQHLKRHFGVGVQVRQAQRWLHRMGYRMKRAGYVYVQAKAADAKRFQTRLKKTPESGTG